jgi:hypothetical protein
MEQHQEDQEHGEELDFLLQETEKAVKALPTYYAIWDLIRRGVFNRGKN